MAEYNQCANLIDEEKVNQLSKQYDSSKDPLQDMLNMQEWLQDVLSEKLTNNPKPRDINTKGELIDWIDANYDAMMDEFRELKTSVGGMSNGEKEATAVWKRWKQNHLNQRASNINDMSKDDRLEMLFEMIDIHHFYMNMLLGLGLTSKDIYILYMLKNEENYDRYTNRNY